MGDWLFGWFYDLMYILQKSICYLLDFIRDVFCKLAGIETVVVNGEQSDLLSHFILSPQIRNAFLGVFLVGVILLCVFVIIAILKSEAADPQHKKTKGQILVKALQSFIIFVLIPFLLIAAITLTNVVMSGIHASMTGAMIDGNTNSCIGGQILVTSGYDAYIGPSGQRAEIERMFITGQLDYNNLSVVKDYYNLGDMNFFVGIAGGLVILIMFVISAIMFVQRIFDIILLYIVSPASVSTIPLDDGGRFKIWREMLISKILGAYGIILSMNIFFLIVPQIGNISFFNNAFKDGIVQLLFVLGGAFAITKANMVIAQLTGSNAGAQEAQQMLGNISTGMHMMRTVGHVAAGTAGMVLGGTDFLTNRHHNATFTESLSSAIHSQRNQRPVIDRDDDPPKGGGDGSGGSGGNDGTNKDGSTVQDAAAQNGNGNSTDTPNTTETSDNATAKPTENSSDVSDAASAEAAANADMESVADTENSDGTETPTGASEESSDVAETAKKQSQVTFGSVVKGATRLATLPAGIVKDLIQGGVIVAGKNFGPRVRNVLKGTSIVNHADVKKPLAEAAKKSIKEDKKE